MLPRELLPRVDHQLVAFIEFCASFFTWWRGTLWRTRDWWSLNEPQQFLRSSFLYSSFKRRIESRAYVAEGRGRCSRQKRAHCKKPNCEGALYETASLFLDW